MLLLIVGIALVSFGIFGFILQMYNNKEHAE